LPSVGVSRLQFDAEGFIYVTTTSGDPEQIKYSEQIDVTRKTVPIIMKVDSKNGKVLWKLKQTGDSCLLSGKIVYAFENTWGDGDPFNLKLGVPEHTQIYRIHPKNGRELWHYYEKHHAQDIDFRDNTIALLFAREMKVLRFLTL